MSQGFLFRACRHALRYSERDMQLALCLPDRRTLRRIEGGTADVHGPTWIALGAIMREAGIEDLALRIDGIVDSHRERLSRLPEREKFDNDGVLPGQ
jgi:hypothetical protein